MSLLQSSLSDKNNQENVFSIFDNINNYKFDYETKLGEGRFGKVRLAYHKLTNEKVAIKVIDKNQIKLKEDRKRIDSEILILKQIYHYNIAKLFSVIENEERIYLIQEYVQGFDLNFFIKKKEKPEIKEQLICKYFRQIISAVEYIHKLGIAHRDLKPENILINKYNDIKLVDFGLSKFCSKGELINTPCGSPFYAAPEMVKGDKYNGINTDIWSLGIVLYLMLFQELPFMDANISRLYKKILEGKYEIPKDKLNEVSKEAIDLVQKIIEINPKKRIKINGIKNHKWFNKVSNDLYQGINIKEIILPIDEEIVEEIKDVYGYDKMRIRNTIIRNLYNNIRSLYFILLQKKENIHKESVSDLKNELYLEYINDEKNKCSYYDNNIENILKNRMKSFEILNEINYYEENEETLKDINIKKNILNINDHNSNSNDNCIRNKKDKKIISLQKRNIKNNEVFEKFVKLKTNDFFSSKKVNKKINIKENMKLNFNDLVKKDSEIYSERARKSGDNQRYNSNKNISHSKSININKKISEDISNKVINISKRNEIKNMGLNKSLKRGYLAESYDKSKKIINKNSTKQRLYKKNNAKNTDLINKNNNVLSMNKCILDKINSNNKNPNAFKLKKIAKNNFLISSNNKSIEMPRNNKNIDNSKINHNKNLNISELKIDNDNSKLLKLKSGNTSSNFSHPKNSSKNKKLFNSNTLNRIKGKKIGSPLKVIYKGNNKNNPLLNNYKSNVNLLNKQLKIKMHQDHKSEDNIISNSVINIDYNANNLNENKIIAYSTIYNENKNNLKNLLITNSSSKPKKNKEKIIMVNLNKKKHYINNNSNINQNAIIKIFKSSHALNTKVKKKVNSKEKKDLNPKIFNQKNIINCQTPFDLSSLFIFNNCHNINNLIEKFFKNKKMIYNPIKDKNSKNLIYYNCKKKSGLNFNINLSILNKDIYDKYSLYICNIRNLSNAKYDYINFINSFYNCCK